MKKVIVKVIARAEVELGDDYTICEYDIDDIDRYVKNNYLDLAYPESEFKLVGYEVDTVDSYKKRIQELEIENCKLKEKLDLRCVAN